MYCWVNAIARKTGKERVKRIIIGLERSDKACFARTKGRTRRVFVVCIRDVSVGDGHIVFLHVRDVRERYLRRHGKTGKAWRVRTFIDDGLTEQIIEGQAARTAAAQLRIDVFGPVERIKATVAAGFIGQDIRSRMITAGTKR